MSVPGALGMLSVTGPSELGSFQNTEVLTLPSTLRLGLESGFDLVLANVGLGSGGAVVVTLVTVDLVNTVVFLVDQRLRCRRPPRG